MISRIKFVINIFLKHYKFYLFAKIEQDWIIKIVGSGLIQPLAPLITIRHENNEHTSRPTRQTKIPVQR